MNFINKKSKYIYLSIFFLISIGIYFTSRYSNLDTFWKYIISISAFFILLLTALNISKKKDVKNNQELDMNCDIEKYHKQMIENLNKNNKNISVDPIRAKVFQLNIGLCYIYKGQFELAAQKINNIYLSSNEYQKQQIAFFHQMLLSFNSLLSNHIESVKNEFKSLNELFIKLPEKVQNRDLNNNDSIYRLIKDTIELYETDNVENYNQIISNCRTNISKANRYYALTCYFAYHQNIEQRKDCLSKLKQINGNIFYLLESFI